MLNDEDDLDRQAHELRAELQRVKALIARRSAGEDTAEDMPDIMREHHPDGAGGVKTLATFTARPKTCQGTYDEVMAARQRVYVENLGVRTPRT